MKHQRDNGDHRVHQIVYRLVWTPKRLKPVLVGEIARDCRSLIEGKCAERGWHILELAINPNYVHLLVRVDPSTAAVEVVRRCKGITSHELRRKYPALHKLPSLWTRAYFASTEGNASNEEIQKYVAAQKGR